MSNSTLNFEINSKDLLKKFSELSPKKQTKVYQQSSRKALQPLVRETKKNLKKELGTVVNKKDKYGNSLNSGVKMKIYKDGQGGNVNILSNFKDTYCFEKINFLEPYLIIYTPIIIS